MLGVAVKCGGKDICTVSCFFPVVGDTKATMAFTSVGAGGGVGEGVDRWEATGAGVGRDGGGGGGRERVAYDTDARRFSVARWPVSLVSRMDEEGREAPDGLVRGGAPGWRSCRSAREREERCPLEVGDAEEKDDESVRDTEADEEGFIVVLLHEAVRCNAAADECSRGESKRGGWKRSPGEREVGGLRSGEEGGGGATKVTDVFRPSFPVGVALSCRLGVEGGGGGGATSSTTTCGGVFSFRVSSSFGVVGASWAGGGRVASAGVSCGAFWVHSMRMDECDDGEEERRGGVVSSMVNTIEDSRRRPDALPRLLLRLEAAFGMLSFPSTAGGVDFFGFSFSLPLPFLVERLASRFSSFAGGPVRGGRKGGAGGAPPPQRGWYTLFTAKRCRQDRSGAV